MRRRTTYGAVIAAMTTDLLTRRIAAQFMKGYGGMIGELHEVLDDIRRESELCALSYDKEPP